MPPASSRSSTANRSKGWDGDPTFWRVENGAIVGESSEENPVKQNTFVIFRGGEPADFELKVELRINAGNTGVQYRSVAGAARREDRQVGDEGLPGRLRLRQPFTGMLYEERGRGIWHAAGRRRVARRRRTECRQLNGYADELKPIIKVNDWNQFHVIARGNTLIHILNGRVTATLVDDDVKNRSLRGLLGFQIAHRSADEGGVQEHPAEDAVA